MVTARIWSGERPEGRMQITAKNLVNRLLTLTRGQNKQAGIGTTAVFA
jgi:hypothetical protein